MSIIVHKNEPIDNALKRLHAEAIRENVFNTVNDKRYFTKLAEKRSERKREWKKRKKRSRSAKRKMRNKGL
ncbi:ribosomal protein S21/MRP21 [Candidatus Dojkabacteria bacterium]|nr:ribosomal protein S21/MRP21 [Candidatus Dojkabacteria bacterium]